MAKRPSVKEILEAARRDGQPSAAADAEPPAAPPPATDPNPAPPAKPAGRPLTLQEKLAAARSGGASAPQPEPEAAAAPPTPAPPAGRRLTLQEKLAAARSGGASAPAPAAAEPAAVPAAVARVLPPINDLADPRDVAEALRRVGARKTAEAAGARFGG